MVAAECVFVRVRVRVRVCAYLWALFSIAPALKYLLYFVRVYKCACVSACAQQQFDDNQQKVRNAHAMRYN